MEKKKKIHKETITQVYDNRDGDKRLVQQTTSATMLVDKEPDYVKLYITDIMRLTNLPKSSNSLIMQLLRYANYDNEIVIIKYVREKICNELGLADVTFRKGIEQFIEKGILSKKSKGVYIANPFLFGRGAWQDIKKIRLLVEYSSSGRFLMKQETTPELFSTLNEKNSAVRFNDKIENTTIELPFEEPTE